MSSKYIQELKKLLIKDAKIKEEPTKDFSGIRQEFKYKFRFH